MNMLGLAIGLVGFVAILLVALIFFLARHRAIQNIEERLALAEKYNQKGSARRLREELDHYRTTGRRL